MNDEGRWPLALAAIRLLATGTGLGGAIVRGPAGPVRDAWVEGLAAAMPLYRLPPNAEIEALDGGLDLAATLAAGRPVQRPGLLARPPGAILIAMAERIEAALAARLVQLLDAGAILLVLCDEGQDDERVDATLAERLALQLDFADLRLPLPSLLAGRAVLPDPAPLPAGGPAGDPVSLLTTAAQALGVGSLRASLQAIRVARAAAALAGRPAPAEADLALAAMLVLGPRATRLPPEPEPPPEAEAETPPPPPPPADAPDDAPPPPDPGDTDDQPPQEPAPESGAAERLMEAAATSLPAGLLEALAAGTMRGLRSSGKGGARQRSVLTGRPAGARSGMPGRGKRLAILETIKAAAPWQRLRRREQDASGGWGLGPQTPSSLASPEPARGSDIPQNGVWGPRPQPPEAKSRLRIRRDDLMIRRNVAKAPASTIFAVDASGSAAFARLAEAKGAIELLLAEAYVKRAEVALVAFRGDGAVLALPPTRSLTRARRELASLAGGGGTPMAAGIDLARKTAEGERGRGRTPLVVVLTDGRANVGGGDGVTPQAAALASARALGNSGVPSVFIDCGVRARPEARALAEAMGARYAALPRLDAGAVAALVKAAA